jgi:hypothetical protein
MCQFYPNFVFNVMLWPDFCGVLLGCRLSDDIICVSTCVYGCCDLGIAHKFHRPWLPFSICRNTDFSPLEIIIALLKWHCGGNVSRQINMLDDKKIATVCNHVRCMDYSDVIPNSYMIMAFSARRELWKGVKCNKFFLRFPQYPNFCVAAFLWKFFCFEI